MNIKPLVHLHFFVVLLIKKFKLSAPFTQCAHTHNWKRRYLCAFCQYHMDIVFKNGPNKFCGRQPLKNLKWYGLLEADNKVDNTPSYFWKAVFQKFYLVHSWILCPNVGSCCDGLQGRLFFHSSIYSWSRLFF